MKKTYIILLNNNYLLFVTTPPKKKGNYLAGVRLFETKESTTCAEINAWKESKYTHDAIKEVTDWE